MRYFALFHSSQRDIERLCERKYVKNPPARFFGSPTGRTRAFSLPAPLQLSVSLNDGESYVGAGAKHLEIANSGFLQLPPHAVATGDGITLRSESTHSYTSDATDMTVFVIPTFNNLPDLNSLAKVKSVHFTTTFKRITDDEPAASTSTSSS